MQPLHLLLSVTSAVTSKAAGGGSEGPFSQPVRILVVDDHKFMRELICRTLSRQPRRYRVIAEAGTAAAAIAACAEHSPDLAILDINLPDRSGLEIVAQLKKVSPATRVLLCTAFAHDYLAQAMRSGAEGFVEKTNTWSDFLNAVESVSSGERYFRSRLPVLAGSERAAQAPAPAATAGTPLSPRERQVLAQIATGSTSKEIAAKLHLSVQTVETHRANLMHKLHVHNVAGLVLYAVRNQLVEFPSAS